MNMSDLMGRIRDLVSGGGSRPAPGQTTSPIPPEQGMSQPRGVDPEQRPMPGPGQETPPQGS